MSDYMHYTQWQQREESLPRELEQARVMAERVAEERTNRRAARAERTRRTARIAGELVAAVRAIRRATSRSPQAAGGEAVAEPEREPAYHP